VTDPNTEFAAALATAARDMLAKLDAAKSESGALADLTLEHVFRDEAFMAVPASPLQLAITRVVQGRPIGDAIDEETCRAHFGCAAPDATTRLLRRVVLICGIRGGKSTLSVAQAITACFTVDLSSVPEHEITRYPIVGPDVQRASDTYNKLLGYLQNSPALARYIDGVPTADTVTIKRPDGRCVEVSVVAASKGGRTVRGVWLVGLTLEEAASFGSEATGAVVNAEDILRAAEPRLLPGAQAWVITSPFGPSGLVYELYRKHYGQPNSETLVVHAPTRALNPSFPQASIDAIAKDDPDNAAREYGAEWVDADSAFLESTLLDAAMSRPDLFREGRATVAAMDPATRGNAWTLSVGWSVPHYETTDGAKRPARKVVVAGVWQWVGTKKQPLSPREIFREMADILRPYGVSQIYSDQWSLDALADHAVSAGLRLAEHEGDGMAPYVSLRTLLSNGLVELPPDPVLRQDLLSIRKRAVANGVKIFLPTTADGRHCDYAPSVALTAHYAELAWAVDAGYEPATTPESASNARSRFEQSIADDNSDFGGMGRGGRHGGMV
jgi:hypothetical protein